MLLYHYTNGTKLEAIQRDGFIKSVPEKTKLKEKPIAWLSDNAYFEKTANKIVMVNDQAKLCNMQETAHYCNGLYRFAFNKADLPTTYQWPRLAVEARIPEKIKRILVKRAKAAKVKTAQWFGVLGAISITIASLEKWDGRGWLVVALQSEVDAVAKGHKVITQTGSKRLPIKDSDWGEI